MSSTSGPLERDVTEAPQCKICGGPIKSSNKYGICSRNEVCRKEARNLAETQHRAKVEAVTGGRGCKICGGPCISVTGICGSIHSPGCFRERSMAGGRPGDAIARANHLDMLANYLESHTGKPGLIYNGTRFRETADGVALLAGHDTCECCGISGDLERIVVDHDHSTGLVRGVLCNVCNGELGSYRDNVEMIRRYAEILRTPGMPNPDAAERAKWDGQDYIYSKRSDPVTIELKVPVSVFEFTDHGKTLTVTVNGKSSVKHRELPMTPQDKRDFVARLKTMGTVYWEGQEM
jgi:hypothetical protein